MAHFNIKHLDLNIFKLPPKSPPQSSESSKRGRFIERAELQSKKPPMQSALRPASVACRHATELPHTPQLGEQRKTNPRVRNCARFRRHVFRARYFASMGPSRDVHPGRVRRGKGLMEAAKPRSTLLVYWVEIVRLFGCWCKYMGFGGEDWLWSCEIHCRYTKAEF
jgi:hypothetical protein